ncbi:MAG: glycosyltransferase family 2 protein [Candidatus Eisenbacteria bacterium]|uniref:Glycosyltransferase family 2 protein n=1 Tax=Eiseniibacteriota bacterium TaxID=2212470 RepID=A0A7Y2H2E8_UNCEI|nr:glycosyltransferase family 2 protein [Candidatus Eisenbacteria bacterium]
MLSRTAVVIPALNEERSIGKVLGEIPEPFSRRVVVADNGSKDNTVAVARGAGATVVHEPQLGYGAACLRALEHLKDDPPEVVLFIDGDFSDYPSEMPEVAAPLLRGEADLVIGSRVLGNREKGALLPQARFGNILATFLMRVIYRTRFTDLGPFRGITWEALERIRMEDRDFGWTVEMQIKAAKHNLRSTEVPVSYRKRIGKSKVSGTVRGTFLAGKKILWLIFREAFSR